MLRLLQFLCDSKSTILCMMFFSFRLVITGFLLPPDHGEKVSLGVRSFSVLFRLLHINFIICSLFNFNIVDLTRAPKTYPRPYLIKYSTEICKKKKKKLSLQDIWLRIFTKSWLIECYISGTNSIPYILKASFYSVCHSYLKHMFSF